MNALRKVSLDKLDNALLFSLWDNSFVGSDCCLSKFERESFFVEDKKDAFDDVADEHEPVSTLVFLGRSGTLPIVRAMVMFIVFGLNSRE